MTRNQKTRTANALSNKERTLMDAYWRAANYLSVGQIYLYDNPLLKQPLAKEHIKPRLLGHWGTTPGLNFIYVHLNRLIKKHDLDMIYITGPGHGGPGLVANAQGNRIGTRLAAVHESGFGPGVDIRAV
jgi:xylulose-5-phosphate/fructose-6-phosphate phosphoketolase